jgi:NADH-quinone oxidoreductase subunit C
MAIQQKKDVIEALEAKFGTRILEISEQFGDEIVSISPEAVMDIAGFLYAKPYEYTMLLDLTCVDYLGDELRYEMVYHFFSMTRNHRLRIKARLPEKNPKIQSMTPIWKNANWLEREVYDMFGVTFDGHPYMRRLFMYDEFEGHPLRKDYPLRKRQPKIRLRKSE